MVISQETGPEREGRHSNGLVGSEMTFICDDKTVSPGISAETLIMVMSSLIRLKPETRS